MPKHKIIHVERIDWVDSSSLRGWQRRDAGHSPSCIMTVGLVVGETKDAVTVSHSISEDSNVPDALSIPKVAIVRRRRFPRKLGVKDLT